MLFVIYEMLHAFSVALVEEFTFFVSVVVQVLEVAQDTAGGGEDGEGAGVLLHDGAECSDLRVVDHTQQNVGFPAGVHTLGRNEGSAVVEGMNDVVGDFIRIVGDDFAVNGAAAGFQNPVRDGTGHEGIEDAEQNRLQFVAIDEVAAKSHCHIDGKTDPEEAHFRMGAVNQRCDKIHAAGSGTAPHQEGIGGTVDDAGNQRAEDFTGAIGCLIAESGQVDLFQQQQTQGERHHINHAAACHGAADLPQDDQSQRDVNDQAQVTDTDAGYILNHGTDTVQAGWRKMIWEDKQLIVEGTDQCQQDNEAICPEFFCHFHWKILLLWRNMFQRYTTPYHRKGKGSSPESGKRHCFVFWCMV